MESADVVVIGSGLVGAAIAFELSRSIGKVVVVESGSEVAAGVSRSNSGILHTGFDSKPGVFETQMILSQASRWREIFTRLGIPFRVPGALMLARNDEEEGHLEDWARNAAGNGVPVERHDAASIRLLEPNVTAQAGLRVPGEATTDPYEVVSRLLASGPAVLLNWPVRRVEADGDGALVTGPSGKIRARFVLNCAGLFADEIAQEADFRITARRGEFLAFPAGRPALINNILLPIPNPYTKGVLVFPTLYDYLIVGPTAEDQEDKNDWQPRPEALAHLRERAVEILPALKNVQPVGAWAGLRPVGHPHNYYVEWSARVPSMMHVAGIRSTGLSACLGLSLHVRKSLAARGLDTGQSVGFPPPLSAREGIPWWHRLNTLRGIQ